MNAEVELREAYEQLADSAPDRSALTLPSPAHPGRGRRREVRGALVACAVVLLAVVPFVLVHRHHRAAGPQIGSSSSPRPGHQRERVVLVHRGVDAGLSDEPAGLHVRRRSECRVRRRRRPGRTAGDRGRNRVVRGHRRASEQRGRGPRRCPPGVSTPRPIPLRCRPSGRSGVEVHQRQVAGDVGYAIVRGLIERAAPRLTARGAVATRDGVSAQPRRQRGRGQGRLPAQGFPLHRRVRLSAPRHDAVAGRHGRHGLPGSCRSRREEPKSTQAPSIDITAVYEPNASLSSAASLPTFEQGPWTRTTLRGHLAWTDPHTVLIQWGPVQLGVSSSRITGSNTPLVGLSELLKVARSLTVPAIVLPGFGYPLTAAVPAGHLQ